MVMLKIHQHNKCCLPRSVFGVVGGDVGVGDLALDDSVVGHGRESSGCELLDHFLSFFDNFY